MRRKEKVERIWRRVVGEGLFWKESLVRGMCEKGLDVMRGFRNDVVV